MQLPEEVMANFNKYLASPQIMHMDPLGRKKKLVGEYTICDGEEPVSFHNVELVPPAGFFGTNYTWYAQPSLNWYTSSQLSLSDSFTMNQVPTSMVCHSSLLASPGKRVMLVGTFSFQTMESRSVQQRTLLLYGSQLGGMGQGWPTVTQRPMTQDSTRLACLCLPQYH